jgi:hypothetical protein
MTPICYDLLYFELCKSMIVFMMPHVYILLLNHTIVL